MLIYHEVVEVAEALLSPRCSLAAQLLVVARVRDLARFIEQVNRLLVQSDIRVLTLKHKGVLLVLLVCWVLTQMCGYWCLKLELLLFVLVLAKVTRILTHGCLEVIVELSCGVELGRWLLDQMSQLQGSVPF